MILTFTEEFESLCKRSGSWRRCSFAQRPKKRDLVSAYIQTFFSFFLFIDSKKLPRFYNFFFCTKMYWKCAKTTFLVVPNMISMHLTHCLKDINELSKRHPKSVFTVQKDSVKNADPLLNTNSLKVYSWKKNKFSW